MRSLIIRFMDIEGPGIIESVLKEKNYQITYHNAYNHIHLIPQSHQIFDTIVLMGGSQTVADDSDYKLFKPYYKLVENFLSIKNKKVIGVCLGGQILSRVLGGKVTKGNKGTEVGFSNVKILNQSHPIFKGIDKKDFIAFHLHGDMFTTPAGAENLLSSEQYENQFFSYQNKAFGFQCHLEITEKMMEYWWAYHSLIPQKYGILKPEHYQVRNEQEKIGRIIFNNILS